MPVKMLKTALIILCLNQYAIAQSANPAWLDKVELQLSFEEECEVGYYIRVQETELAGQNYYEARAQCVDGRQFDATREGDSGLFIISKCEETTVC